MSGSASQPTLGDLDPALDALLLFYPAVVEEHLGARWNAEVDRLGLDHLSGSIVAQSLPYDPLPLGTENDWRFPLFCVYPTRSTYEQSTYGWYSIRRQFDVLYVLPPLNAEQGERLYPFLTQVERVIVDRSSDGFDDAYQNGTNIWAASGVAAITVKSGLYGKVPKGPQADIFFPTLQMQLEVVERRNPYVGNFEPFAGVLSGSIDIASGSGDGGTETGRYTDFVTFTQDV